MEETLVQQKITIKTVDLQDLVSKSVKACGFIDQLPLTGMLNIVCKDGKLTITSTDGTNILELVKTNIEGEISVVVDGKLFAPLIAKLSTPITELALEGDILKVNANGKYEIKAITEEDGSAINFKTYEFDKEVSSNHINPTQLKTILTMNKSCKADMKEMPSLFNYYMDNTHVVTTDFYKACINPVKVFDTPVCLPPELVNLMELVVGANGMDVRQNADSVLISSEIGTLYGKKAVAADLEQYPAEAVVGSFDSQLTNECSINRTLLINALDRISLFVQSFDVKKVTLKFEKESVTLIAGDSNSTETVKYLAPSNVEQPFSIDLDGLFFKNQLIATISENIVLKFGNPDGIQIVCDDIKQSLSSVGEEETAE